jgi:hypothetical protein
VSVDFGYEASTNGSGDQDRLGKIKIPGAPVAAAALARTRPELLVGAAFAGGLITAFLLRRLAR